MQDEGLIEGKYQVIRKIKEGGMGAIYKVRHVHLDEIRVVKVMRPQIEQDADARRRFFQEAKLATSLKHPNVAALYDFAEDKSGNFFMVMEFIDGVNLSEYLQAGIPPLPVTVELSVQALSALGFLHSRGIVHRDVSPDNFMVTTGPDGGPLVKLIDLGVAKQTGVEGGTMAGMFIGKLKYGSPEQFGRLEPGEAIDGRSDLYSFGCILYLMATGQFPYDVETAHGYVSRHLATPPRPFEETDPDGRVPEELRRIILKALEKDRTSRWATAEEFAGALAALPASWRGASLDASFVAPGIGSPGTTPTPSSASSGLSDMQRMVAQAFGVSPTPTHGGPSGRRLQGAPGAARIPTPLPSGSGPARWAGSPPTLVAGGDQAAPTVVDGSRGPQARTGSQALPAETARLTPAPRGTPAAGVPRPAAPAARESRVPLLAVLALAFLVLSGGGIALWLGRAKGARPAPGPISAPVSPEAPATGAPAGVGSGTVLLTAAPWGELVSLVNETTGEKVDVSGATTPVRLQLAPGSYVAKLAWRERSFDVRFLVRRSEVVFAHGEAPGFDVESALSGAPR